MCTPLVLGSCSHKSGGSLEGKYKRQEQKQHPSDGWPTEEVPMLGLKTRRKSRQWGQSFKGPLGSRGQKAVSLFLERRWHPPTGFLKGCALQMGKVLHFLLWSSSEPVVWVWKRPGVAQCSAGHQPSTPSGSRPPDPNQCASRVRADRETGRGYISYLMGQNKAVIFLLDEKVLICFTS